jgi:hypothetical protein
MDLFQSRGKWALEVTIGDKRVAAFLLPLPGKPKREHLNWSDWLPRTDDPKVADGFRYRYRVMKYEEWRAENEAAKERARQANRSAFEALGKPAPMREVLKYLHNPGDYDYLVPNDVQQKAMDEVRNRRDEVAALAADAGPKTSELAVYALLVSDPSELSEESVQNIQNAGTRIAEQLAEVRQSWNADDPDPQSMKELQERFLRWLDVWELHHTNKGRAVPVPPALEEILQVAGSWEGNDEAAAIAYAAKDHRQRWQDSKPAPQ